MLWEMFQSLEETCLVLEQPSLVIVLILLIFFQICATYIIFCNKTFVRTRNLVSIISQLTILHKPLLNSVMTILTYITVSYMPHHYM